MRWMLKLLRTCWNLLNRRIQFWYLRTSWSKYSERRLQAKDQKENTSKATASFTQCAGYREIVNHKGGRIVEAGFAKAIRKMVTP